MTKRPPVPGQKARRLSPAATTAASALAVPALLALAASASISRSTVAAPVPHKPETTESILNRQYTSLVKPFLSAYCTSCHGKDSPSGGLDLTAYASLAAVLKDDAHWARVGDKLAAKQMPPSDAESQPTAAQREAVLAWLHSARQYAASLQKRNAGDPGIVLARRLSNAEYDYTIRDLTGVDLQPAKQFPVDPANQEGFDNSGETLTLDGPLLKKYIQAAKEIADHAVLTSTGIEFATHPVIVETDRDKFCVQRIVKFYKSQPTDFADYFEAAWRYRYRAALGKPNATLDSVAAESGISPRYLPLVWQALNDPADTVGPMATLRDKWNALPAPAADYPNPNVAHAGCVALRDWVTGLRKKVACKFPNLKVPPGFSVGGQVFVLWKDNEYAAHRRDFDPAALQVGGIPNTHVVAAKRNRKKNVPAPPPKVVTDAPDPDLAVPEDESERAPYLASFAHFANVFPDAFYISERGRMFMDDPHDAGRLLSAGLHNSMGYFRDDTPLMQMILSDADRAKLDAMWQDFDMVAFVPERMHSEFFVYERAESGTITDPEFNFAKAEDKSALTDPKIKLLHDLYRAKAVRNGAQPDALQAIDEHFVWVSKTIRTAEKERIAAEPLHRAALLDFAHRAYRRPLTDKDRADILGFYNDLRTKDGESHEEAIRDSIARILLSPDFLFRVDLEGPPSAPATASKAAPAARPAKWSSRPPVRHSAAAPSSPAGPKVEHIGDYAVAPLSDYELANRLSYFLWASMPDDELLAHAAKGDLHKPEVLRAETHRMLKDGRVRALALEFGGNWLDFRRFEEANSVDRNRFPTFTNDLREAMFEEPVHFFLNTFQNNGSVLDLIYGNYTFVNAPLAAHYGMKDVHPSGDEWARVDNADKYGRGGLLPMAVFLTENSPGLRTSPVKRGYWLVKRLLGEYIPPPPATVPELPKDEAKSEQTLRQALARHRSDPACAGCHARFDSYGLVFEGYDPIGQRRTADLAGRPIDDKAPFPGGTEREGVTGLQAFLKQERPKDFVYTLDRKLLVYALGRSIQPSDEPTLDDIYRQVAASRYHFDTLVDAIVSSRQFRYRRVSPPDAAAPSPKLARN